MSSLKNKNYNAIYGDWEAPIQRATRSQTIKAKMANGEWHIPTSLGWKLSEQTRQRISQSLRRFHQTKKHQKQLTAAINLISSEIKTNVEVRDTLIALLEENRCD